MKVNGLAGFFDGRLLRVLEGLYGAVRRKPEELFSEKNRPTRADEAVLVLRVGYTLVLRWGRLHRLEATNWGYGHSPDARIEEWVTHGFLRKSASST
jgi:hypothetical protein